MSYFTLYYWNYIYEVSKLLLFIPCTNLYTQIHSLFFHYLFLLADEYWIYVYFLKYNLVSSYMLFLCKFSCLIICHWRLSWCAPPCGRATLLFLVLPVVCSYWCTVRPHELFPIKLYMFISVIIFISCLGNHVGEILLL